MLDEVLTEDLLERLLCSKSPEDYLCQEDAVVDCSLSDYLYQLLGKSGMNRSQLAGSSGVNTTYVYDIFKGRNQHLGRDNAIKLALGLRCSLVETQRLLRLAGVSELWPKMRRDAIIIWCIEQGMTRTECDDELYRLNETMLLDDSTAKRGNRG